MHAIRALLFVCGVLDSNWWVSTTNRAAVLLVYMQAASQILPAWADLRRLHIYCMRGHRDDNSANLDVAVQI